MKDKRFKKASARLLTMMLVFVMLCIDVAMSRAMQQEPPPFAGTWMLDSSKSKRIVDGAKEFLTITVKGPEITITSKGEDSEQVVVLFTDGRAGTNSSSPQEGPSAIWDGKKLTVKSIFTLPEKMSANGKPSIIQTIEEWELSKDGKTLFRKVRAIDSNPAPELDGPAGEPRVRPGEKELLKYTAAYKRMS